MDDEKVLIPKFILFQQGKTLFENKPPHRGILKLLAKHDLNMDAEGITMPIVKQRLSKGKAKVKQRVTKPLVTSNSNSKGNSKVKEESVRETISDFPPELDDLGFIAVWSEWNDYRTERKLPPYKTQGRKAQLSSLSKWATQFGMPALIESIRASIANNYQGLFEPRPSNRNGNFTPTIDRDYDNAVG